MHQSVSRLAGLLITMALGSPLGLLAEEQHHLYVSAGGALSSYAIDSATGRISFSRKLDLEGAGPFLISHDRRRLYVAAAGPDKTPRIATVGLGKAGQLTLIHVADARHRAGQFSLDRTGRYLAGNSYKAGLVAIWEIDSGVYRGKVAQTLELEPKAHGANFSHNNRWLLVPATAPNKVFISTFDESTGRVAPHAPPFAPGPAGAHKTRHPRHLLLHPDLPIAYTTCESREPGVCVWTWDEATGRLEVMEDRVTRPANNEANTSTSTLHLSPNRRFLYVAVRNRENSSIVGFKVDPETGRLTRIGHTPCEIVPRSFCLDPRGMFLYAAGQRDNKVGVYAIDQNTGELTRVQQIEVGTGPRWIRVH
ncbi:MAG: beta-propeller fold lactonase family protein [Verrucomicrobiota bacterium]